MKYYTSTTDYNCGIDLHAHQMYVCLMDRQGKKLLHRNIQSCLRAERHWPNASDGQRWHGSRPIETRGFTREGQRPGRC